MSDRLKAWAHLQRVNPVNEDSKLMAEDVDALFARIAALEALVSEKDKALSASYQNGCQCCCETSIEYSHLPPNTQCETCSTVSKALSLTQTHPRILAIGKVLGAAKELSDAVNRDVDRADWNDRVYEAGTRLDAALAEYEASK